jgi:hypothetical protein
VSTARPAGAGEARGVHGVRDEVELFGWPQQMLGCRHVPVEGGRAGVLVCLGAPFGAAVDQGRAARLGRRLAGAGVAVQRFHPRGSAPSDGAPGDVTFGALVDDAQRALDLLRERGGVDRVGFVGSRLGALVVARVLRGHPGSPVALWQPAVDPRHVVEQAARLRAATRWAHPGDGTRPSAAASPASGSPGVGGTGPPAGAVVDDGLDVLDAPHPPDLFDSPLSADLADGGAVGRLADELGDRPGALLLVQTAAGDTLGPEYLDLVERCRSRHVPVDARAQPCDGERDGAAVPAAPDEALIDATATWLAARLVGPDGAAPPRHVRRPGAAGAGP